MRSPRLPHGVALLLTASVGLALLHACQDSPKPTELESAVTAALRTLTVTGSGTGDGVVTSSPAGIKCTVTAGTAAATGCKAQFSDGVVVTLTAMPKSGHSFRGWFGSCTGTGTCKVSMTADRAVEARFLKGPFTIRISGGTTGTGSGTVKSQPGLTPAINCAITKGVAAATGCSATYPATHLLGSIEAHLPAVVHRRDPRRGIGHPGHPHPALLRHARVQPEPAHLSADLLGYGLDDA